MNFGETLKAQRKARWLTQRELATAAGYSYETVRSFEYGRRKPRGMLTIYRLSLAMGLSSAETDELLSAMAQGQAVDFSDLYRQLYKTRSVLE